VFADLDRGRPDVIFVASAPENFTFRELIVGLVNEARIPAMYPQRQYVEMGGLISYGLDPDVLFRHAARQIDMILRGLPVSDVPWYRPTTWELFINLRTAKMLGLDMPPSILARADMVIE
jgi:putative ABC transport system substrate-binding protein